MTRAVYIHTYSTCVATLPLLPSDISTSSSVEKGFRAFVGFFAAWKKLHHRYRYRLSSPPPPTLSLPPLAAANL